MVFNSYLAYGSRISTCFTRDSIWLIQSWRSISPLILPILGISDLYVPIVFLCPTCIILVPEIYFAISKTKSIFWCTRYTYQLCFEDNIQGLEVHELDSLCQFVLCKPNVLRGQRHHSGLLDLSHLQTRLVHQLCR